MIPGANVSAIPGANVSAIVLAAGASTRMGRPKQLLPFRGQPLLQHVVDAAHAAGPGEIIVVLGHAAPRIQATIHLPDGARVIVNPDHASGQASSLRAALRATAPEFGAALILMGDQPGIEPRVIRDAIGSFRRTGGPVVRAEYEGRAPGHPVVLGRTIWDELLSLEGDTGAREVLARHPEWIVPFRVPGPPPVEVDTPEDYRALLGRGATPLSTPERDPR